MCNIFYFILSSRSSRHAASSTSSASYQESHAVFTTSVNYAAQGCGTAATSPLWSVLENIQTHRAAPMEALPPPSPPHQQPHPHLHHHRTPPPRLYLWARKAPKPEIFSPSGSSHEVAASGSLAAHFRTANIWIRLLDSSSICCRPPEPLLPVSLLLWTSFSLCVLQ